MRKVQEESILILTIKFVPEILIATIEPPPELEIIGDGRLIEAHVCRQKKIKLGYSKPTDISESIPFIHYDIHRQLMYKLRIYGLNAIFGLKIQISLGESMLTAVATGTAVYARALAIPLPLKVMRNLDVVDEEDEKLMEVQGKLMSISEANRKRIEDSLKLILEEESKPNTEMASVSSSSDESSDDDLAQSSLSTKKERHAAVVQIDDEADEDL